MKRQIAILKNENEEDHLEWIKACDKKRDLLNYTVIDITKSNWLDKCQEKNYDIYLTRPPGNLSFFKQLYDERIYILHHVLRKKIYPTLDELLVYENKRMLNYWLEANQIPYPKTYIYYSKNEALDFIRNCKLPIVSKTSIGASASGVKIFTTRKQIRNYINKAFSTSGIKRKGGPNLRKGDIKKRLLNRLKNIPNSIHYFYKKYRNTQIDPQRWHVIFQEYLKTDFEWRCVRIGDSFFAHKKLSQRYELKSGTSKVSWDAPPVKLLDFIKEITDKMGFLSQAVDIFEDNNGNYLVNELQCFFGSKNPHQMIINEKPGRYINKNEDWVFEEGHFNTNNSFDLRLEHVIVLLNTNIL